jgi:hypothetical protein
MSVVTPGWNTAALVKALTSPVTSKRPNAPPPFGVRLALRHALAVELRHLLDEIVILQENRPVRADGERVLVALDRDTGIRRRRIGLRLRHCRASS